MENEISFVVQVYKSWKVRADVLIRLLSDSRDITHTCPHLGMRD